MSSPEYMHNWRVNNREKVHGYNKKWRLNNPEKVRTYRNEYLRKWRANNRDKLREYDKRYRTNHPEVKRAYWQKYKKQRYNELRESRKKQRECLRLEALRHYAENSEIKCSCCGEKTLEFLTLDHSNNDGGGGKRKTGTGTTFYWWLKRNNYPQNLGLKILCFNCNLGRKRNICPHKRLIGMAKECD